MSDTGNVCKFSSSAGNDNDLFAYQFIYETNPARLGDNRAYSAFVCHLVTEGSGEFQTAADSFFLEPGDIFFAFPSLPFTLSVEEPFKYLYIAFIGSRASDLLESLGVTREMPVRRGLEELTDTWFSALRRCSSDNLAFMAKGLLYYTFAYLKQSDPVEKVVGDCDDVVAKIREAVERDFSKADLSLEHLCHLYGYNTKYISRRFRQIVGVGFSDYLISCRIRHACVLLDESKMTIREISAAVGYQDALYFSKVFKRIMKTAPSGYREEKKEKAAP